MVIVSNFYLQTTFNLGYVIEGAVGNVLGYFFVVALGLLLVRLFENKAYYLFPVITSALICLVTSHTLTPVIYFGIFSTTLIAFTALKPKKVYSIFKEMVKNNKKWLVLGLLPLTIFFLYIPQYFYDSQATDLVKMPFSKSPSLQNSSIQSLIYNRLIKPYPISIYAYLIGFISLALFSLKKRKRLFTKIYLFSWLSIPILYVTFPDFFLVYLPSYRVINYVFYPLALAITLGLSWVKKTALPLVFVLILIYSLQINVVPVKNQVNNIGNINMAMEENKDSFLFLSTIISEGDNILAESMPGITYPNAIRLFIDGIDTKNELYIKSSLSFKYLEGYLPLTVPRMLENPHGYLDEYSRKKIKYLFVPNNSKYNDLFIETNFATKIYETNLVQILKII